MRARYVMLPFTPLYDFIVERPMTIHGRTYARGDTLDKTDLSERLLRQLYEQRKIIPSPGFGGNPAPRYLNNGLGKADQLRVEIEREEAEQNSVKGEGDAQPRSDAEPAAPRGARAAKPADTVGKKPAERLGSKPAAKSAPKRAQARSR